MGSPPRPLAPPRWLHRLAVLAVAAAVPLLLLGAEVTTKKVGMADPKGFRPPWELVVVVGEFLRGDTSRTGLLIEHTHRLAGMLVGLCAIALAVGLWWQGNRPGLRWLGVAALAAVCAQGLLGKYRVDLNALVGRDLALVHGCFAQLVFGLLVSVALFTSRAWAAPFAPPADPAEARRVWRRALGTTGLVYLQIVLGALVRHEDLPFGARLHLLTAFGVVAAVAWLVKRVTDLRPRQRQLGAAVTVLAGLVCVQLVLGVEAWMARFPSAEWNQVRPLPAHPELFRSLHSFTGSLVFAAGLVVTLQAYHRTAGVNQPEAAPVGRLEGAA